eukprot:m.251864 g.251864  ORF g.251864 m.251864 type:complete len:157 (+) comp26702_c0_seq1:2-472(+)
MHYLHSQQPPIVHRDLKPGNVLLDKARKTTKIIDFGLATTQHAQASDSVMGTGQGTPAFMAPELHQQGGSLPVDFFSYGMFVWNIFARTTPFAEKSVASIPSAIKRGERPDITLVSVDWMQKVVENCWRGDPQTRWSFAKVLDSMTKQGSEDDFFV